MKKFLVIIAVMFAAAGCSNETLENVEYPIPETKAGPRLDVNIKGKQTSAIRYIYFVHTATR